MVNLQSTINNQGNIVTQIIHFVGGIKRTYTGVITSSIKQGQFTKFMCKDGTMIVVNDANVLCIEVFTEKSNEK
jgi:hypothetical protein